MEELEVLKRKLEREKAARKEAESILEKKALELFNVNERLRKINNELQIKLILEAEELVRSEEKYRGIIEGMELGLLEVDLNHKIVRAYDWFCDMTGYLVGELEGKNALEILVDEEDLTIMDEQDEVREQGQAGVYEMRIKKKNGEFIWVLISGTPLYNFEGKVIGSMGIHYDISDRKKMEQELQLSKKAAEAARDAEKQFLARMSHEIRTPLNAIIGMAHLLSATSSTPEQKDHVTSIKTSGDLLLKIVSDILDISKIEANEIKIHKELFNLRTLVISLQKTFQVKIDREQVKIFSKIDENIENLLIGDELLLTQILMNLISNAVKFTKVGTIRIGVKLLAIEQENYILEFEVSDTGVGIQEEKLNLIFENFKQADEQVRHEFGGTGLGLAISKKFVELQGGEIWAESEYGKGTSFKFKLGYINSGEKDKKEDAKDEEALQIVFEPSELLMLIVEDNFMNRKYITTLLRRWGIYFHVALNGEEAVEMTKEYCYDLIFMDISMPVMDGYEATRLIRNEENLNNESPIVALTASAILSKREQALGVGMTDYIPKPFAPTQLLEVIRKYTNRREESVVAVLSLSTFREEESIVSISTDEILDISYLQKFYGEDYDHAADMFDTFLSYTVKEVPQLRLLIEQGDWDGTRRLAHRIKPNFSMVGLPQLEKKILAIEKMADKKEDANTLINFMNEVESKLAEAKPFLTAQLEKYKSLNK